MRLSIGVQLLAPALLVVGCLPEPYVSPHYVRRLQVPGVAEPVAAEQAHGPLLAFVMRIATTDLACPDASLERRGSSYVLRARGCGRQHLYELRLSDLRRTAEEPNTVVDTYVVSVGQIDEMQPSVDDLVAMNVQGAKDLGCPREQVVPEVKSLGRGASMMIVEGCGKRATYLSGEASGDPLRLTAKVDAPEAPLGFTPWDGSD